MGAEFSNGWMETEVGQNAFRGLGLPDISAHVLNGLAALPTNLAMKLSFSINRDAHRNVWHYGFGGPGDPARFDRRLHAIVEDWGDGVEANAGSDPYVDHRDARSTLLYAKYI